MRSRQVTIHDPRAAAVFTNSHLRRILLHFATQPRSISDVARDLTIDPKHLHHAVTRLCRLGLLQVTGERQRAGRPIKLDECSGESYFIPNAAAPVPFSMGLAKALQSAIARDTAATMEGTVFTLDAVGRVPGHIVEKQAAGLSPLDSWRILRMSVAQANRLKKELAQVLDRFQREADANGQVYLVHAGMAQRLSDIGATDNAPQTKAER